MKQIFLSLLFISIILIIVTGCSLLKKDNNEAYDKEFRSYLKENYGLQLNDKSTVKRCETKCDFYGFYTIGKDYNYAVQISKTGDKFEVSYDKDAVTKRKTLYEYIKKIKGNDIAPNYLGFYQNTYSGIITYSSSESRQLYYIVKYNDKMNLNEELKKDYDILKKAQQIIGKDFIKEMIVLYIKDEKLNDEDWITKLNIDISDYSYVIYSPEKYFNKPKYQYRINNYKSNNYLASISYKEFENLVMSNLETN